MVPGPSKARSPRPAHWTGARCVADALPASRLTDVVTEQFDLDETRPRGVRLPRRERRAQLLAAALEVFVAQGYHAAAMDDIAERAGVSKPVLYQHFPGKLELYLAILDAACDSIIANCREALESTQDNKQRVAAAIDAFYAYVGHDTGAFRLVFESDLTNEPAVRGHVDRVTTECAAMIASVIKDDTGLPSSASQLLAVSLVGMAQVSARFWLTEAESGLADLTRDQATALVAGLAWRGIRGYPLND
ncbi:TetR family transcriptional regulator [Pimelobacter sp. 30-1]|nr:TetR family transcriptional regulator [Pimelobacter sp. 30-1]